MKRLIVLIAVMALVAAACSSGSDADDAPATTAAAPAATDDEMADDEMADDEMADDEMADDEMADDEMADDEMADDEVADDEMADARTFVVRIENTSGALTVADSGAFAVPQSGTEPGPVLPGDAYEFDVRATPGQRLSLATMFVQSNDWFFAPGSEGVHLYDTDGVPVDGDITDAFRLYDAGTEVDQAPGEGVDQAPRQSGPNTGAADETGTVRSVSEGVPAVADLIAVTATPAEAGTFTVRIENISGGSALPTPLAPGVYAVHTDGEVLFTPDTPDRGEGLEALAEDGNPSALADALATRTGVATPLAPGAFAVHGMVMPIFSDGEADRGSGLEALAEDGDPSFLVEALAEVDGVIKADAFAVPASASEPGPVFPGDAYEFEVTAAPGEYLSFATMFVQSNDLFFAPEADGIDLFPGGTPIEGDVTDQISLWDAGTEFDEPLGIGASQAPRQAAPNTGDAEDAAVSIEDLVAGDYITVTVMPQA